MNFGLLSRGLLSSLSAPSPLQTAKRFKCFKGAFVAENKLRRAVHPPTDKRMPNGTLMDLIEKEEIERRGGRILPPFKVGDFMQVTVRNGIMGPSSKGDTTFEGLVLGIRNRGVRSSFMIRGRWRGTLFEQQIPMYGPWATSAKVLESYPVRYSKLYYMRRRQSLTPISSKKVRRHKLKVF